MLRCSNFTTAEAQSAAAKAAASGSGIGSSRRDVCESELALE